MHIPTPDEKRNAPPKSKGESFLARCLRTLDEHTSIGASPSIPPSTPDAQIDDAIKQLRAAGWKCELSVSHEEHAKDKDNRSRSRYRTLVITEDFGAEDNGA